MHERTAVAWHDGPDWAGRPEDRDAKDFESIRLAAVIPEPSTRGAALPMTLPDVLVDVTTGASAADTVRTVHSLLRQSHRDLRVRLPGCAGPELAQLYDGAVRFAPWTRDQLRRARVRIQAHRPLPPDAVAAAVRAVGRARRWNRCFPDMRVPLGMFGTQDIELGEPPPPCDDLAGFLHLTRGST